MGYFMAIKFKQKKKDPVHPEKIFRFPTLSTRRECLPIQNRVLKVCTGRAVNFLSIDRCLYSLKVNHISELLVSLPITDVQNFCFGSLVFFLTEALIKRQSTDQSDHRLTKTHVL